MNKREIASVAAFVKERFAAPCPIGIVLGSGLGAFAEQLASPIRLKYTEIPHFSPTTVTGHKGELSLGEMAGKNVAIMSGRFHYYEGYDLQQVIFPIRALREIGVRLLILTNAAGAINESFRPGSLMLIEDHINMIGSPLRGENWDELGPRFPDMTTAYSERLRNLAKEIGTKHGIALHEGVYIGIPGPNYETPAEIRMMRILGADAVGMSTVPEVIAARHMGMEVLGVSCISNMAAGISKNPLSHEEVFETTNKAKVVFAQFLREIIATVEI